MLAYPLDEAESMLSEKLSAAELSLSNCEEDLEFLREQITVCFGNYTQEGVFVNFFIDIGGCYSTCVQLGCGATTEREG